MTLVDQCVKRVCSLEHRKTKSDSTTAGVPAYVGSRWSAGIGLSCYAGWLL